MSTPSDPGWPTNEPTSGPGSESGRDYGSDLGRRPEPVFRPESGSQFPAEPEPELNEEPGSQSEFGPPRTWRRFFSLKRILLVMLGLFLLGAGVIGVAFAITDVPQPNEVATAQASIIYYSDGKTEMARISKTNREIVPFAKIPPHVRYALLAAEDRSFYTEHGISPTGIGRALLVAVKGGPTQGGSTITQQYVKNYFLTADRTLSRKAKEFIISIKIDQSESKDTILANYLNTIYYGRGANGIQTASKAYFGKDVSQLTVSQGALLASVIRGPAYYDPGLGKTQTASAKARWKYVLDGMVAQGWLSPQERAKATFPKTRPRTKPTGGGTVGYIVQAVRAELEKKVGLSLTEVENRGGLRIVTTIDKRAQAAAVRAVDDNMPSEYKTVGTNDAKALHVGLTAIRPGDGAIVAMYGGKDYSKRQYNTSTDATLQGGSTFKVFGMLAALQKDISTKTTYDGHSPQGFKQFADFTKDKNGNPKNPQGLVHNFADEQFGRIDLRTALADSVNTVFAQLNIELAGGGTDATGVRDAAVAAGLPKGCVGNATVGCTPGLRTDITNIFGTASTRVRDMANAYATIAAGGKRATPYLISSVTSTSATSTIPEYKVSKVLVTVFDNKVTADVTDAMTRVVTEGTASKNTQGLDRPAAGKTGTSSENKAVWFDGFTPQLSTAVGIYQGTGQEKIGIENFGEVTGGTYPTEIWAAFMKDALQGQDVIPFPARVGVGDSALAPVPVPTTPKPTPTPSTTSTPVPSTTTPTPTFTRPRPTRTRPTGSPTQTSPPPTMTIPPTP